MVAKKFKCPKYRQIFFRNISWWKLIFHAGKCTVPAFTVVFVHYEFPPFGKSSLQKKCLARQFFSCFYTIKYTVKTSVFLPCKPCTRLAPCSWDELTLIGGYVLPCIYGKSAKFQQIIFDYFCKNLENARNAGLNFSFSKI